MVVGDDAQSIFGVERANFANIYQFKDRYPDACRSSGSKPTIVRRPRY